MQGQESGATGLEMAGIISVAALVVGGISLAITSSEVEPKVQAAICRIMGGDCSSESADAGDAGNDQAGPDDVVNEPRSPVCTENGSTGQGLPINFTAEIARRFPNSGSISESVSWVEYLNGPDKPGWNSAEGEIETGVQYAGEVTIGQTTPDAYGMNWTEVGIEFERDNYVQGSGEVTFRGIEVSASYQQLNGLRVGMSANVPSQYLDDGVPIQDLPHPLAPENIPPGGSLTLTAETFSGTELSGALEALEVASFGSEYSDETSLAITPVGENLVQVAFGTADVIEHGGKFGIFTDSTTISDFELQQYTLDLSTPEGQDAYLSLLTGQLPENGNPGVVDSARVTGGEYALTRGLELGFDIGDDTSVAFGGSTTSTTGSTLTENSDGTTTFEMTQFNGGQYRQYAETRSGDDVIDITTDVTSSGIPGTSLDGFNQWFGGDPAQRWGEDATANLAMNLNQDDLRRIRNEAYQIASGYLSQPGAGSQMAHELGIATYGEAVSTRDLQRWLDTASPEARSQFFAGLDAAGGDFATQAAQAVIEATYGLDGADADWGTWAAFTDILAENGEAAAQDFMTWAATVQEITGQPYIGFGDVTCVTVG